MTEHLPECLRSTCRTENCIYCLCICPKLRACEKRVRVEEQVWHWRQGVQAARDAVAALPAPYGLTMTPYVVKKDALAAIDALREES